MGLIRTINNGYAEYSAAIGFIHLSEFDNLPRNATIGSIVHIIETGERYILDDNNTWCLLNCGCGSGGSTGLKYVVVDELPPIDQASGNTIYMVENENHYDFYIKSSDTYVQIADTLPIPENLVTLEDLEDYVKKTELTDGSIENIVANNTISAKGFIEDGVALEEKYAKISDLKDNTPTEIKNISSTTIVNEGNVTTNSLTVEGNTTTNNITTQNITIEKGLEGNNSEIDEQGNAVFKSITINNENGLIINGKNLTEIVRSHQAQSDWAQSNNTQPDYIKNKPAGGGSSGTSNYESLTNKPQINGHTLQGNQTAADLDIEFEQVNSNWTETNTSSPAYIQNKPDLSIYRLISDSYSKEEIENMIGDIENISFSVVTQLPTEDIQSNVIYLMSNGTTYDMYVYTNNQWVQVGSTDVDLSDYATTESVNDNFIPNAGNNKASNFSLTRNVFTFNALTSGYAFLLGDNNGLFNVQKHLGSGITPALFRLSKTEFMIDPLDNTWIKKTERTIDGIVHSAKAYYGNSITADNEIATIGDIPDISNLASTTYVDNAISAIGDFIPHAGNTKSIDFTLTRNKTNITSTTGGSYIAATGKVPYDDEGTETDSDYNVVLTNVVESSFNPSEDSYIGVGDDDINLAISGTTGIHLTKDSNNRTKYQAFFNGGYHKPTITLSMTYFENNQLTDLPLNAIYRVNIEQDINLASITRTIPVNMEIEFYSQIPHTITGSVDYAFANIGNQAKVKFTNLNFYGMGTIANIANSAHITFENCTFRGIDSTVVNDISNGMLIIRGCVFDDSFVNLVASAEGHYTITNNYFDDDSSISIGKSSETGTDPVVIVMGNRCNSVTINPGITKQYVYNNGV